CDYSILSETPIELKMNNLVTGDKGFVDGPAEIHSVENIFNEPAVSLHIYAKPFDACDIYDLENKTVERVTLKYYSQYGELC
ncbi:hypothetical protein OAR31_06350, partial [Candidatus Marinimicrobia bacterium]|nr:hypothetical protein [Candidatus Neomarinimicrobiota bacterium]